MRPGEPIEATLEETDAEFDDRLCRVIAKAETTIYTEAYVRKPLAQGSAPSHNALACIADGGIWHEFVPATPADTQGRFRLVLFKFSENGPSAIGFFAGWAKPVQLSFAAKTTAVRRSSSRCVKTPWAIGHAGGPAGDRFVDVIRTLIQMGAVLI